MHFKSVLDKYLPHASGDCCNSSICLLCLFNRQNNINVFFAVMLLWLLKKKDKSIDSVLYIIVMVLIHDNVFK